MNYKTELLEKVHVLFKRSKGLRNRALMHPRRDWLFGIALFLMIALVGGVLNARTHVTYKNVNQEQFAVSVEQVTYDAKAVASVIEFYEAQAARVATLQQRAVPDPMYVAESAVSAATGSAPTTTPVVSPSEALGGSEVPIQEQATVSTNDTATTGESAVIEMEF